MAASVLRAFSCSILLAVVLDFAQRTGPMRQPADTNSKAVQVTFGPVAELGAVCSPDGNWLAFEYFSKSESMGPEIWMMPADGPFTSAKTLVNDGLYHAGISWSPSSEWLSYTTAGPNQQGRSNGGLMTGQIYKVSARTGKTVQLTTLPKNTVLEDTTSWSTQGEIAFSMDDDIYAVRDSGGDLHKVVDLHVIQQNPNPPQDIAWSPDGKSIAFVSKDSPEHAESETATLWLVNLEARRSRAVLSHQQIAGVSWIGTETLLLTLARGERMSQIYSLSLTSHNLKKLTAGPHDLWPCLSQKDGVFFFNRAESSHLQFERSIVPALHIWRKRISLTSLRSE